MPHVSFRDWQLRAAVVLVIAFAFSAVASTVQAANTVSFTGQVSCTQPSDPEGGCEYTTTGTSNALFAGQFIDPLTIVSFDPNNPNGNCLQQMFDVIDLLCGHYHLDVGTATGTITVTINYNPDEVDAGLCIVDAANQPVAGVSTSCSTSGSGTETVTLTLNQCVDPHFEAHILPFSYLRPPTMPPSPADPVKYTGTVTSNLRFCGGVIGSPVINPTLPAITATPSSPVAAPDGRHLVTGSGKVGTATVGNRVYQGKDGHFYGKVGYTDPTCKLRSTSIDSVVWDDLNQRSTITGKARWNGGPIVNFVLQLDDNGAGASDIYSIQSPCTKLGNMLSGNIAYRS